MESVYEAEKKNICSICDYSSSRKDKFMLHIKSVHEEKKPFKCDICDPTAALKRSVNPFSITHCT